MELIQEYRQILVSSWEQEFYNLTLKKYHELTKVQVPDSKSTQKMNLLDKLDLFLRFVKLKKNLRKFSSVVHHFYQDHLSMIIFETILLVHREARYLQKNSTEFQQPFKEGMNFFELRFVYLYILN